jgi:hypothetical protein
VRHVVVAEDLLLAMRLADPSNTGFAIAQAEILAKFGWLIPEKTWRYDMRKWRIVRGPNK